MIAYLGLLRVLTLRQRAIGSLLGAWGVLFESLGSLKTGEYLEPCWVL